VSVEPEGRPGEEDEATNAERGAEGVQGERDLLQTTGPYPGPGDSDGGGFD
jgi:hypothetical protein